jgi:hypothetical protein
MYFGPQLRMRPPGPNGSEPGDCQPVIGVNSSRSSRHFMQPVGGRPGPNCPFDKAVADKRIRVRRNGTRILVPRSELNRFIEALPAEPG